MAESYGRFNYGEKIAFLYHARGSVFETKFWINRAANRTLIPFDVAQMKASPLADLARQHNAFTAHLKRRRADDRTQYPHVREDRAEYVAVSHDTSAALFSEADLRWLES